MTPAPSSTSRYPRSTACARPSPTPWALAASCVPCGPFPSWRTLPGIWRKSARTPCSSTTPTPWPCSPATCSATRGIETVGLCHSVQVCSQHLLEDLGMEDKLEGRKELIAGINHMAWLLEIAGQGRQRPVSRDPQAGQGEERRREARRHGALRLHRQAGLLLHRVQRAQRRVQLLLHQERTTPSSSTGSTSPWMNTPAAASTRSRTGKR